jgi:hypothetical protein
MNIKIFYSIIFVGSWSSQAMAEAGAKTPVPDPARDRPAPADGAANSSQRPEDMDWGQNLNGVRQLYEGSAGGEHGEQGQSGSSIEERARAYVEKKRREEAQELQKLKDMIRCDWLEYEAISKKNNEDMDPMKEANTREDKHPDLGSFVTPIDGRIAVTGLNIYRGNKSVVSMSFDPQTQQCRGCSGHDAKKMWTGRESHGGQRQVIILTDQCFPAVLPAHGSASCCRIIRREYGSLNQLAGELTDLARGKKLEKESIVLLFSGTHLARAGATAYMEDLVTAVAALKAILGQEIKVTPLPPLFLGGCNSTATIRSCAEMAVWADATFNADDGYMMESFRMA